MLTFTGAVQAIDNMLQSKAPQDEAIGLTTPVQFDPDLMPRLRAAHEALNARFATLVCSLDRDNAQTAEIARDCIRLFHELRRAEAIWLYPVIARAVEQDDSARSRLMELRLLTLTIVRRALRGFEALSQAIENGTRVAESAEVLSRALAQYQRNSETDIYPLYRLASLLPGRRSVRAA